MNDEEEYEYWWQEGYDDYMSGLDYCSPTDPENIPAYSNGWDAAKAWDDISDDMVLYPDIWWE